MRVAIQGELGSNSHMAALAMVTAGAEVVPVAYSAEVLDRVVQGEVDAAVLPIENSLHGSVIEHYDLLAERPLRLVAEHQLRIRHNLIAVPGTRLEEIREVLSHTVALSQCRRWFREHAGVRAVPFYDTAGGVKTIVAEGRRDRAALAPVLAAEIHGGVLLEQGLEDHAENLTRFHVVVPEGCAAVAGPDKMTVQFSLEHRPGTLVDALRALADEGADLTKIESRPVPGRPWEYVFYADLRFRGGAAGADGMLRGLGNVCRSIRELGRYRAAHQGFATERLELHPIEGNLIEGHSRWRMNS